MRDKYRDEEYFKEYIDARFRSIDYLTSALEEDDSDLDRTRRITYAIISAYSNLIKAQYSYGKDLYKIKEYFDIIIEKNKILWEYGFEITYYEIYELLALSILLDADQDQWGFILQSAKRNNMEDGLTRLYEKYLTEHIVEVNGKSKFGKNHDRILDIVANSENIAESLAVYLRRDWYRGNRGMYWYGRHKNNQFNAYNGYWSLEAAAVAKMCNIDDTILKDKPYYPYDLVHYKEIVG